MTFMIPTDFAELQRKPFAYLLNPHKPRLSKPWDKRTNQKIMAIVFPSLPSIVGYSYCSIYDIFANIYLKEP